MQSLAVQYGLENRPLPASYSLMTEVAALRAALDGLGVERADLIGMSHGGVTALLFALGNPHRVRTLTLVEPPSSRIAASRARPNRRAHDSAAPRTPIVWSARSELRYFTHWAHCGGDYDDDPARLRTLSVPTLVIHGRPPSRSIGPSTTPCCERFRTAGPS
ncbi:MAG TPA: alpha/beta fold hydrolase, partial [Gemmatimonadaceae bacterium]